MTRIRIIVGLLVVGFVLLVGQAAIGTDSNQVDFWCEDGMKFEPVDTPFIVPEPPPGATWTLLVLKGGTTNETVVNPVVGQAYSHSTKDNSHVILCYEEEVTPSTTTTSTTTSTTTTAPTTTTSTTVPTPTTTTTIPTTTTTSEPPTSTTTVPPSTTSTTEVPPPTYIESGDAGYFDEVEEGEEHEDEGFDWLFFGMSAIIAGFAGGIAFLTVKRIQERP